MSIKETGKKQKTIVDQARRHLRKYFKRNTPIAYKFHQYSYFKEVVKIAKKIAEGNDLSDEQTEILLLVNWFRFGGITVQYENYQQISADMAEEFLTTKKYPVEKIKMVIDLIMNTSNEGKATDKLAECFCGLYGAKRVFER